MTHPQPISNLSVKKKFPMLFRKKVIDKARLHRHTDGQPDKVISLLPPPPFSKKNCGEGGGLMIFLALPVNLADELNTLTFSFCFLINT